MCFASHLSQMTTVTMHPGSFHGCCFSGVVYVMWAATSLACSWVLSQDLRDWFYNFLTTEQLEPYLRRCLSRAESCRWAVGQLLCSSLSCALHDVGMGPTDVQLHPTQPRPAAPHSTLLGSAYVPNFWDGMAGRKAEGFQLGREGTWLVG